jgi:hypothetical protein
MTMPILTEKDIQIRCRDMANELRDQLSSLLTSAWILEHFPRD